MDALFTGFFSFFIDIGYKLIDLANILYGFLTYEVTIPGALIPNGLYEGDLTLSMWILLSGGGLIVFLIWRFLK